MRNGYPEMNFSDGGCDFCEVCVAVCTPGALNLETTPAFSRVAVIGDACFAARGVICRSCGDVCEVRAISFRLVVGGVTHVNIVTAACSGCGECVGICPANSITLKQWNTQEIPA